MARGGSEWFPPLSRRTTTRRSDGMAKRFVGKTCSFGRRSADY
ncbi:hypothetical protein SAMD00023519_01235 [Listeria monocytogenes]|nr:hypothetical protein SAMD00023519_01235 [Listeria monocytogenes]